MLFVTIVLDGVGVGAQPDAAAYGDEGSHTLGHVCAVAHPHLPHLAALGLGCIARLDGVPAAERPAAAYGRMQEVSAGKDSTTGHWELAGLRLDTPFPTYPDGFPEDVLEAFTRRTGCGGVLGNKAASGTAIIAELGAEHERTGYPIVYTSADSVFQVAAHTDVIALDRLYAFCRTARDEVCVGEHAVGRVIARPFAGPEGGYQRLSAQRKDFSLPPPAPPVQQALQEEGIRTVAVGKIGDLFAGVGFDDVAKTRSNAEGVEVTLEQMHALAAAGRPAFVWANLVDFDQDFGHRGDAAGFARALEAFDEAVPRLTEVLPRGGCLVLTADHGNDPTTPSTDHSREYVPLLAYGLAPGRNLGLRPSFADHAATVAAFFGVPFATHGTPFF